MLDDMMYGYVARGRLSIHCKRLVDSQFGVLSRSSMTQNTLILQLCCSNSTLVVKSMHAGAYKYCARSQ